MGDTTFENFSYIHEIFQIIIYPNFYITVEDSFLKKYLPLEDFCLYRDFPFNQLIILYHNVYKMSMEYWKMLVI